MLRRADDNLLHLNIGEVANATGGIACTFGKPNARWPSHWSVTGSFRREVLEAGERTLKAAIYGLNRAGGRTRELEQTWIIHALVRARNTFEIQGFSGRVERFVPGHGALTSTHCEVYGLGTVP